jgi:tRNA dimethylallyltransferase
MNNKVICLLGPTGTGKTAVAIALAKKFQGEVVNFDSRQVYKDFPIITAQPSLEEQQSCPHHLYGFLDSRERTSVGKFTVQAEECITQIQKRGGLPILVGGTGLYIRTLTQGMAPIPTVPPEIGKKLQEELDKQGLPAFRARLEQEDPVYAAKIHPNDPQRTFRALEVLEGTGKPLSWWHDQPTDKPGHDALKIAITADRKALTDMLARRIEAMLQAGAMEEARQAFTSCPDPEAPAWSAIGCAELLRHIQGEIDLDQARALWLKRTKAYAKRQMTWFNKEPGIEWFHLEDGRPPGLPPVTAILERVQRFLA